MELCLVRTNRIVACILMLSPLRAECTSIVAVWTKNRITIVADSKQTVSDANGATTSQKACKVYQVRNTVFAIAGLAKIDEIDVVNEIKNHTPMRDAKTGAILPIESIIIPASASITKVLISKHAQYAPNAPIQMLIAGWWDGELRLARWEMNGLRIIGDYSLPDNVRQYEYPDVRGHDGTDPNRGIETIGMDEAIKAFKASTPGWNKGSDHAVAERLVTVEINDPNAKQYVGKPISTIVVTKGGIKWKHRGACK